MGRPNVGEGRTHWPAAGVLHDFTNELLQNSNFVTRAYFLRQVFVSLTPLLFLFTDDWNDEAFRPRNGMRNNSLRIFLRA